MSWSSFWKLRPVTGHFLANSDYDHEFFLKISILFSKQSRCYLPDSYGDPQAEQSSLVVVRRKLEWKLDFRAFARSSAEGPPIVVAFSRSRCGDPWSKRDKSPMKSACDYPLSSAKPARKPASFEEPVSETRCFYRFAIRYFPACGCTAARWSGCRSGTAKKSSHPWHFRCWSPSRNDLECTNLVHWTEALHRFSSREANIVVGSALEKHFDGDFTQPRSRKRNHFQTLATGVPELKTLLGTQRVKK